MSEIVERLRAHAEAHEYIANADEQQAQWMHDLYDAASEIERLRDELAALRDQEPVAWSNGITAIVGTTAHPGFSTPLYAAPVAQPAVSVPEGWESELLDWVSACRSAYHIDNTPGHRFGGLGSNLEENRQAIVEYVRDLLAAAPEAKP